MASAGEYSSGGFPSQIGAVSFFGAFGTRRISHIAARLRDDQDRKVNIEVHCPRGYLKIDRYINIGLINWYETQDLTSMDKPSSMHIFRGLNQLRYNRASSAILEEVLI